MCIRDRYQIKAVYGFVETTISIELTNAIESTMTSATMETAETVLEDAIKDGQIDWMIDGGVITSFFVNGDENSIVSEVTADSIALVSSIDIVVSTKP